MPNNVIINHVCRINSALPVRKYGIVFAEANCIFNDCYIIGTQMSANTEMPTASNCKTLKYQLFLLGMILVNFIRLSAFMALLGLPQKMEIDQ